MKKFEWWNDSRGGLSYIYAIPPASLRRVRIDYATGQRWPEFKARENIICLPVWAAAPQNFQFKETHEWTEAGDAYTVEINGYIPPLKAGGEELVRTLEQGAWMVLHTDLNGISRLSGTADIPLKFTRVADTGASPGEQNAITFSFSAVEPEPSIEVQVSEWDNP